MNQNEINLMALFFGIIAGVINKMVEYNKTLIL